MRRANPKVGIIPYYVTEDAQVLMAFMIPSDPTYGGDRPQIAKGEIENGEAPLDAAIREGIEELGLRYDNMIFSTLRQAASGQCEGQYANYPVRIYAVRVKDQNEFDAPHHETKERVWMTYLDFVRDGREQQEEIVSMAFTDIAISLRLPLPV